MITGNLSYFVSSIWQIIQIMAFTNYLYINHPQLNSAGIFSVNRSYLLLYINSESQMLQAAVVGHVLCDGQLPRSPSPGVDVFVWFSLFPCGLTWLTHLWWIDMAEAIGWLHQGKVTKRLWPPRWVSSIVLSLSSKPLWFGLYGARWRTVQWQKTDESGEC